jgi:hyperosmotically inducible protein
MTRMAAMLSGAGLGLALAAAAAANPPGAALRDGWILTETKMRMLASREVPGLDVDVDVRHGEVTLFGIVESARAKQLAEEIAGRVDGVVAVHNELEVVAQDLRPGVERSDAQLAELIEDRLEQRAELGGDDIDVEVRAGVVRLTGSVDREEDRLTALAVARATDGVRAVRDDLAIEQP